jgi:L-ascorbate metabolism protein UlaG (beta-lactamase superfamily)
MRRDKKLAIAAGAAAVGGVGFAWAALGMPALGATPAGVRLARMAASPNFEGGKARNLVDRPMAAEGTSMLSTGARWITEHRKATPDVTIPVHRPEPQELLPHNERLRATWLGHSTVLLEIDGYLLLTDPVWAQRAAPVGWAGPSRFYEPPLALEALPTLDAVLISHDHYDHLDHKTVIALGERGVHFFVPLGVGAHLESWGIALEQITEMDWWEDTRLGDLRLVCTPSHHFSGRSVLDRDATLWSSWAIIGPRHRAWFGGDTGPLPAADLITERYGPFDLAMLEIGAWDLGWASIHLGPDAAVALHQQVGGGALLPIHHGTFDLALHDWDQPIVRLQELAEEQGIPLLAPIPGQTVSPEAPEVAPFWQERRELAQGG